MIVDTFRYMIMMVSMHFTAMPIAEKVRCRIWRSIGGIDLKEVKYIYFLSEYNYLFEGENGE